MLVSGLHLPRIVRPDGSEMVGGVLKMGIAWYSPLIVVMLMWKYESYTSNYIYITIGSNIIIYIHYITFYHHWIWGLSMDNTSAVHRSSFLPGPD